VSTTEGRSDDAIERRLIAQAEHDLAERESAVRHTAFTPAELVVFATEHAALDTRRDDLAARGDQAASRRDESAVERDRSAANRDRVHNGDASDVDGGFVDRLMSAGNRDDAAGDRADARDDRRRARDDRDHAAIEREQASVASAKVNRELATLHQAIDNRTVIGQATGVLMERHGLSAERSFAVIVHLSNEMNVKVRVVADQIVGTTGLHGAANPH
jgi:hypothetical protein